MNENRQIFRRDVGLDPMPLDVVRAAFARLVIEPDPVTVDGHRFTGIPGRVVPLHEVRDLLLDRSCPQSVRDGVWTHLVNQSRERGGAWTVGCAGVALPALTRIAATLTARFAGDPRDVHAAVLTGFLAALPVVDLARARIMLRLRWAAYRAGYACVRDALDAPVPAGHGSTALTCLPPPSPVMGHPDVVLARAVAEGVITRADAELIGSTRLEDVSLAVAAQARGAGYEATKKARRRAEHRLAAYLLTDTRDASPESGSDPTTSLSDPPTTTGAGRRRPPGRREVSPTVTRSQPLPRPDARRLVQEAMSPPGGVSGVQERGDTSVPAQPTSRPASRSQSGSRAGRPTAEVPRCA